MKLNEPERPQAKHAKLYSYILPTLKRRPLKAFCTWNLIFCIRGIPPRGYASTAPRSATTKIFEKKWHYKFPRGIYFHSDFLLQYHKSSANTHATFYAITTAVSNVLSAGLLQFNFFLTVTHLSDYCLPSSTTHLYTVAFLHGLVMGICNGHTEI